MMNFSRLTLADVEPWAELVAISFGRQSAEMEALWQWFHQGWQLVAWGAWEQHQLVAQYTCLVNPVISPQDTLFRIGLSVNMAVHPDFRGRGLVKQIAQPVYATLQAMGIVAGVGFSNAAGVKVDKRSKGYGYQVLGKMQPYLLWLSSRRQSSSPLELTTHWPIGRWPAAQPGNCFRFAADPVWLKNRFADHPFRQYRFGVWQEGTQICGIVIDRPIFFGGVNGCTLLMAYGPDLPGLLTHWGRTIHNTGGRFVHWLSTPTTALTKTLRTLGLVLPVPYSRSPYYLTAKPLTAGLPARFMDFRHWDCSGGNIL
ncbi:MAG: GNAT family N-acetyltransferase [Chloroflexota bacterium]|jgi:hypothetical protein